MSPGGGEGCEISFPEAGQVVCLDLACGYKGVTIEFLNNTLRFIHSSLFSSVKKQQQQTNPQGFKQLKHLSS